MIFFAHAGHDHEAPATPTPAAEPTATAKPESTTTTATEPGPIASNTLPPDVLIGGVTLLGLIVFWLLAMYVFKLKLATRLCVVMAALLVIGMLGYQTAPVTSTIALTLGIGTTLVMVLTQLGAKKGSEHPKV